MLIHFLAFSLMLIILAVLSSIILALIFGSNIIVTYELKCDCRGKDNWCPECGGTGKTKHTFKLK